MNNKKFSIIFFVFLFNEQIYNVNGKCFPNSNDKDDNMRYQLIFHEIILSVIDEIYADKKDKDEFFNNRIQQSGNESDGTKQFTENPKFQKLVKDVISLITENDGKNGKLVIKEKYLDFLILYKKQHQQLINFKRKKRSFGVDNIILPFIDNFSNCHSLEMNNTQDFVKFHQYIKNDTEKSYEIKMDDKKSLQYWKRKVPVRIYIHGFQNDKDFPSALEFRKIYLNYTNYNVIIVDWGKLANTICYTETRKKIDDIGKYVAKFINFLREQVSVRFNDIYLVGHSLGAHIAGAAGKYLNGKLPVIFGLDPAGPLFRNKSNINDRLDPTDAKYVEVIHTDAKDGFGIDFNVGHADFYVNGGHTQPECFLSDIRRSFTDNEGEKIINSLFNNSNDGKNVLEVFFQYLNTCSHSKSYSYYETSLTKSFENECHLNKFTKKCKENGLFGCKCENIEDAFNEKCSEKNVRQKMGGEPYTKKNGIFLIKISKDNSESKFILGGFISWFKSLFVK